MKEHELTAIRNQLRELGVALDEATVLRGDNTASIMAAKNPGQHRSALRHLELHAFAVRDLVREMEVELVWVDTESNPSDLLTKAITSKAKFDRFAKLILGAVDGTYATFLASAHRAILRSGWALV